MKIRNQLTTLLLATAFVACKKEHNGATNTGSDCKLSKAYVYGGTTTNPFTETLVYTYAGSRLTQITGSDYYVTFNYAGGRISRFNYFNGLAATVSTAYKTTTYNSDGTIATIDSYGLDSAEIKQKDRHEFGYQAGKLITFTYTRYEKGLATNYTDTHFYTYAGGDITKDSLVINDPQVPRSSIYYYTYDAEENHFSKTGPDVLFKTPAPLHFDGSSLPFFFSRHNVTGFGGAPDAEKTKYSYTTDAYGRLILLKEDAVPGIMWEYACS